MEALRMTHWNASPIITKDPNGLVHVECPVWGDSLEAATDGAESILGTFAAGKLAFIRKRPTSWAEQEFDTQITRYRGYVRFSFKDEPGEWHYQTERDRDEVLVHGFGLNKENAPL